MQRQHILDLVSSLRRQADILEACGDAQEFAESIADIRVALDAGAPASEHFEDQALTREELMDDAGQFECPSCGERHAPDGSPEPLLCKPSNT